jgi:endo-1,4-beta-D-glucanase Y
METTMTLNTTLSRRNLVLGGASTLALAACGGGGTNGTGDNPADLQDLGREAAQTDACTASGGVNSSGFSAKFDQYYNSVMGGANSNGQVYTQRASNLAVCLDKSNSFGGANTAKSEGQGYGMMLAVMRGDRQKFYALWNYTSTRMRSSYGLFNWQTSFYNNDQVIGNDTAPDGEIWIITALLLAQKKWNDAGYGQAADQLLGVLRNNKATYFNNNVVRFVPYRNGGSPNHTDPSYANPAFFQFWEERHPGQGWGAMVSPHRQLLINATNRNGLAPDYSDYSGNPYNGSQHAWDAYRVTMNQALDRNWNGNTSHTTNVGKMLNTQGSTTNGKNNVQIAMYATAALAGVSQCDSRLTPYTWSLLNNGLDNSYYAGLLSTIACGILGGRFVK